MPRDTPSQAYGTLRYRVRLRAHPQLRIRSCVLHGGGDELEQGQVDAIAVQYNYQSITGVISGAIESLTRRFALSDFMKGWATGCVLIGCAVGVLLVGPLSDRFGRQPVLLVFNRGFV